MRISEWKDTSIASERSKDFKIKNIKNNLKFRLLKLFERQMQMKDRNIFFYFLRVRCYSLTLLSSLSLMVIFAISEYCYSSDKMASAPEHHCVAGICQFGQVNNIWIGGWFSAVIIFFFFIFFCFFFLLLHFKKRVQSG